MMLYHITVAVLVVLSVVAVKGVDRGETWIHGTALSTPKYFKAGGKLELVCQQEEAQTVEWYRDGMNLELHAEFGFVVTREDRQVNGTLVEISTLIKTNISSDDGANYECKPPNSPSYTVDVSIITFRTVDVRIDSDREPSDLTLICEVINLNSHPIPMWYRNNVLIEDDDKYDITGINRSLTIHHANVDDIGDYTCSLGLQEGVIFNHSIMVQGGPHVKPFKQSKNQVQGDRLVLDCVATGYPPPVVHWLQDNEPLAADDSRISTQAYMDIENATLTIQDVDYDDAGTYMCVATNSLGESANSTITVRVKDKLAALWPFLGIVAEVTILCIIIFVYEKRRAKKMAEEETPEEAYLTNSNDHKVGKGDARQRK